MHQRIDAGRAAAFFAHRLHQLLRQRTGGAGLRRVALQLALQPAHRFSFVAPIGVGDGGAQRAGGALHFPIEGGEWYVGRAGGSRA